MRRLLPASRRRLGLGGQDLQDFLVIQEGQQEAWQKEKNMNTSVARVTMLALALAAGQCLQAA